MSDRAHYSATDVTRAYRHTPASGASWRADSPLTWDAPDCNGCEGCSDPTVITGVDMSTERPNPDRCGGTGVDQSIPLCMVGIGSVYRARAKTTCRQVFIISIDDANDMRAVGYCTSCKDEHTMDLAWDGWQVVHAVPPAHKETNDE
jgi:hypothetical protein